MLNFDGSVFFNGFYLFDVLDIFFFKITFFVPEIDEFMLKVLELSEIKLWSENLLVIVGDSVKCFGELLEHIVKII